MTAKTLSNISLSAFISDRNAFLKAMEEVADGLNCDITLHEGGNEVIAKLRANEGTIIADAGWSANDETLHLGLAFRTAHSHGDVLSFRQNGKPDVLLIPATSRHFN